MRSWWSTANKSVAVLFVFCIVGLLWTGYDFVRALTWEQQRGVVSDIDHETAIVGTRLLPSKTIFVRWRDVEDGRSVTRTTRVEGMTFRLYRDDQVSIRVNPDDPELGVLGGVRDASLVLAFALMAPVAFVLARPKRAGDSSS